MTRVDGDSKWVDYDAWAQLPLSYGEWWNLPDLEWMRATLPWEVGWAGMGSTHQFIVGGLDRIVVHWPWFLTVECPWVLWENAQVFVSWEDECSYPRVGNCIGSLVGHSVVEIRSTSGQGDGLSFVFSNGFWLDVSPWVGSERASSYQVHMWGATLAYEE